jgi:hypothetical protein
MVVLDEDLTVRATMVGGNWIHRDESVAATVPV